jgi:hypothetical protein
LLDAIGRFFALDSLYLFCIAFLGVLGDLGGSIFYF